MAKVFRTAELDVVVLCIFLEGSKVWHNQRAHELALVGNDGQLLDEQVNQQFRLNHLRSDILAVGSLEEFLDALLQEQFAVAHIAGVARTEIAVFGKALFVEGLALVVAAGNRRTLEQDFVVVANLDVEPRNGTSHRTDGERLVFVDIAHRGQTLGQSIAHHHEDADADDKLLHFGRHIGACRGEEIGML